MKKIADVHLVTDFSKDGKPRARTFVTDEFYSKTFGRKYSGKYDYITFYCRYDMNFERRKVTSTSEIPQCDQERLQKSIEVYKRQRLSARKKLRFSSQDH